MLLMPIDRLTAAKLVFSSCIFKTVKFAIGSVSSLNRFSSESKLKLRKFTCTLA